MSESMPLVRALERAGLEETANELARLARSPELREHLQETFVTDRGGRPVGDGPDARPG